MSGGCVYGHSHAWSVREIPTTRATEVEEVINGARVITRTVENTVTIMAVCRVCGKQQE